jgi:hypothetical protein
MEPEAPDVSKSVGSESGSEVPRTRRGALRGMSELQDCALSGRSNYR